MYSRVRSMAFSRNKNGETVKRDSNWRRRRRIFGSVSWFFLNEWRIASDNYATKHDNLFNFHLYSKDANLVHVTGSTFFHSLQLFLKNRILEPKSMEPHQPFFWAQKYNLKKRQQPKFSNMESHQPYLSFICSVPFWTNKWILHFYLADFRLCPNASV